MGLRAFAAFCPRAAALPPDARYEAPLSGRAKAALRDLVRLALQSHPADLAYDAQRKGLCGSSLSSSLLFHPSLPASLHSRSTSSWSCCIRNYALHDSLCWVGPHAWCQVPYAAAPQACAGIDPHCRDTPSPAPESSRLGRHRPAFVSDSACLGQSDLGATSTKLGSILAAFGGRRRQHFPPCPPNLARNRSTGIWTDFDVFVCRCR